MVALGHAQTTDGVVALTIGALMAHAGFVGLLTVPCRVQADRAGFGEHWQPAPRLARLAIERRGFHDSPTAKPP